MKTGSKASGNALEKNFSKESGDFCRISPKSAPVKLPKNGAPKFPKMEEKRPRVENTSSGSADQLPDRQLVSFAIVLRGWKSVPEIRMNPNREEPGVKTKAPSSLQFNPSFDSFGLVSYIKGP